MSTKNRNVSSILSNLFSRKREERRKETETV